MADRFFIPEQPETSTVLLSGPEAHHLSQVMRFEVGDQVTLFDGQGGEYDALIQAVSKKTTELEILERRSLPRKLTRDLTLAVSLPKGDRQKFLVEKLVELGVSKLIPLKTSRSVAQPNAKVIERIRKQAIAACKQCERNYLMEIAEPVSIEQLGSQAESIESPILKLLAHPYDSSPLTDLAREPQRVLVAIGPEGGFAEAEVAGLVGSGFQPVQLGGLILRVETAALVAATILGLGSIPQ